MIIYRIGSTQKKEDNLEKRRSMKYYSTTGTALIGNGFAKTT